MKIKVIEILTSTKNAHLLDLAFIKDAEDKGIVISKGLIEDIEEGKISSYKKMSKEELLRRLQEEKPN